MSSSHPSRFVRRARPHEAGTLAELQNRSSTHWGYPPDFFDWAPGAHEIPEEYVRDNPVYALEEDGTVTGFYGFTVEDGDLLLDKLFVDIGQIGTGRGKQLWRHAVGVARDLGRDTFVVGSDPNAAPFYAAMGAEWFAEKPTAEPRWTVQMFRYHVPPLEIRPARIEEAAMLHELTQRSTMIWGYEPAFLEWEPQSIAVTPEFLERATAFVLEDGRQVAGYHALVEDDGGINLDKLFVEPEWIGAGHGRRLWNHAIETARARGFREMTIYADPNAGPFYRAMGAEWLREIGTSRPGWKLQVLRYDLADSEAG